MYLLDFDDNHTWAPRLTAALTDIVPQILFKDLIAATPEYIEDACEMLLAGANAKRVIGTSITWVQSNDVAAYHGTRLTKSDLDSIRTRGLVPLDAAFRRTRLERILSLHPDWSRVADRLDATLNKYGGAARAGHREGQVHLTLSRAGLIDGFNHYLTHGSEFDQRVAHDLLGTSGTELLRRDGEATVLRVAVAGDKALNACNRYLSVDECLARGEPPNLVRELLTVWSYGLANPEFKCATLRRDCGFVFHKTIAPCQITDVETLPL